MDNPSRVDVKQERKGQPKISPPVIIDLQPQDIQGNAHNATTTTTTTTIRRRHSEDITSKTGRPRQLMRQKVPITRQPITKSIKTNSAIGPLNNRTRNIATARGNELPLVMIGNVPHLPIWMPKLKENYYLPIGAGTFANPVPPDTFNQPSFVYIFQGVCGWFLCCPIAFFCIIFWLVLFSVIKWSDVFG